MFIFLDETGADRREVLRRHTYSLRGKPAVAHRLLVRGQCLSSIAIMSIVGVLDVNLFLKVSMKKFTMILYVSESCLT